MERRFLGFLAAAAAFVPAVLLLDRDGVLPQAALFLATTGFLWLFARRSGVESRQVVCAVLIASLGEVFLSVICGFYSYRHAPVPLYVPPGHGLFYALAIVTARQEALRRHAPLISGGVLAAGSLLAAASFVFFRDALGFGWWLLALSLMVFSRNRLLLSCCFVYTLLLEVLGTAIGNWRWAAVSPLFGLSAANPPAGVGVLYILLDLIVVTISGRAGPVTAPAAREPLPWGSAADSQAA
ncbi:MAG: hypothetical protein AAB215_06885 [Planctomycetota bacterium]